MKKELDPGFKFAYKVDGSEEKLYFGKNFKFKGEYYPDRKKVLIAKTNAGNDVIRVYTSLHPAQFFKFEINGQVRLSTASGKWSDFSHIYQMLKEGLSSQMISVEVINPTLKKADS